MNLRFSLWAYSRTAKPPKRDRERNDDGVQSVDEVMRRGQRSPVTRLHPSLPRCRRKAIELRTSPPASLQQPKGSQLDHQVFAGRYQAYAGEPLRVNIRRFENVPDSTTQERGIARARSPPAKKLTFPNSPDRQEHDEGRATFTTKVRLPGSAVGDNSDTLPRNSPCPVTPSAFCPRWILGSRSSGTLASRRSAPCLQTVRMDCQAYQCAASGRILPSPHPQGRDNSRVAEHRPGSSRATDANWPRAPICRFWPRGCSLAKRGLVMCVGAGKTPAGSQNSGSSCWLTVVGEIGEIALSGAAWSACLSFR